MAADTGVDRVDRVSVDRSFRRRRETVGDLDMLATADDSAAAMDFLAAHPLVEKVLAEPPVQTTSAEPPAGANAAHSITHAPHAAF